MFNSNRLENDAKITDFTSAQVGALPIPDAGTHFPIDTVNVAFQKIGLETNYAKQNVTYNSKEKRPLVSFVDDDSNSVVISRLYPLFQSKGIAGCCSVITNSINSVGSLTDANLQQLYASGWEFLGHSYSHNPNLSIYPADADLDYQLGSGCKSVLESKGFDVTGFCFPQSVSDMRIRRFTKKYYTYSFSGIGISTGDFIDSMRIPRIALGAWTTQNAAVSGNDERNTLAYYKACVDYAVANNGWLVFMTHCYDSANGMTEAQWGILSDVIDYIKSINVEIVTPREAYKAFGNKVFVGDMDSDYVAINESGVYSSRIVPGLRATAANIMYYLDGTSGNDANTGLTSGTAFKTWAKLDSVLPAIINHVVSVSIAEANYLETLSLSGRSGKGSIVITGSNSRGYTRFFRQIFFSNCSCKIAIKGIGAQYGATIATVSCCQYVEIDQCILDAAGNAGDGLLVNQGSTVYLSNCELDNCISAIHVNRARVISAGLTGVNNTEGYRIEEGGILSRKDATKPTGTSDVITTGGLLVNASGGTIGT